MHDAYRVVINNNKRREVSTRELTAFTYALFVVLLRSGDGIKFTQICHGFEIRLFSIYFLSPLVCVSHCEFECISPRTRTDYDCCAAQINEHQFSHTGSRTTKEEIAVSQSAFLFKMKLEACLDCFLNGDCALSVRYVRGEM